MSVEADVDELQACMDYTWGTKEEPLLEILEGRSAEELAKIKARFAEKYGDQYSGGTLYHAVCSELSGDDWLRAKKALARQPAPEPPPPVEVSHDRSSEPKPWEQPEGPQSYMPDEDDGGQGCRPQTSTSSSRTSTSTTTSKLRCDLLRKDATLAQVAAGRRTLRRGAGGSAVRQLQMALIRENPKALPRFGADADFGRECEGAISSFQRRHGIQPATGVLYDRTIIALDRAAMQGGYCDIPPERRNTSTSARVSSGGSDTGSRNRYLEIEYEGQRYWLTPEEYRAFVKQMISKLRKGAYREIDIKTASARTLWDHFDELNDDQWAVSWLVELTRRVDLPSEYMITDAESSRDEVKKALDSGNLHEVVKQVRDAEHTVNYALDRMRSYRSEMIEGGGNWVTGLKVTSTVCFTIAGVAAGPVLGPVVGSAALQGVIIGAGTGLLSTAGTEIGQSIAGTQDGKILGPLIKNTLTGALAGGAGALAQKIAGPLSRRFVDKIGAQAFGSMGRTAALELVKNTIAGSANGLVSQAISSAAKLMDDPKYTIKDFTWDVTISAVQGGLCGHITRQMPGDKTNFNRLAIKAFGDSAKAAILELRND
ncbi:peptidoglycan-binding protein [Planctomycetota bacterium]